MRLVLLAVFIPLFACSRSLVPVPVPTAGLASVWSLSGNYRGITWDPATGVLHAGGGGMLVDVDATGKVLQQTASSADVSSLRLTRFAGGAALLAFGIWSDNVSAYDLSGRGLWSYNPGAIDDVWPADLDGDGSDEVLVGFNGAVGLHVLDSKGRLVWKDASLGNVWHVTSGDVRGSSEPEVLSTSAEGRVHVFAGDGTYRVDLEPGLHANMVRAGKISAGDDKATIFVVGTPGVGGSPVLIAMSGDEARRWSVELQGIPSAYSMVVAPGKPWIAIGGQGGNLNVVDAERATVIATVGG